MLEYQVNIPVSDNYKSSMSCPMSKLSDNRQVTGVK